LSCKKDLSTLPILSGCPADDELVLFNNAVGGWNESGAVKGYGWRTWGDLKLCLASALVLKPLIGVVDGGGADDPVSGTSLFQNDKLIGLGSTNMGRIQIFIDDVSQSNFGQNLTFAFDNVSGEIDLDNGTGNEWVSGGGLYIDLNQ
jgi:hypothetical protein